MDFESVMKKIPDEVNYAEIRIENYSGNYVEMKNGELTRLLLPKESGYCIRIMLNGKWGFASSNNFDFNDVKKTVNKAIKVAKTLNEHEKKKREKIEINKPSLSKRFENRVKIKPEDISIEQKTKFVEDADKLIRNFDYRIKASTIVYGDTSTKKEIIDSFGNRVEEMIHRLKFGISARAKEGNVTQETHEMISKTSGYETIKKLNLEEFCNKVSSEAIELLKSKHAPSGRFNLIADQELAGVFIHEAVGHGCEADNLLYNTTIFKGKLNKKMGSLTVVDDPTMFPEYGAYYVDSECVKAKKNILIENGTFKRYMTNLETSVKYNLELTGNARASSYQNEPLVRMSCTYIDKGNWSFDEMLEDTRNGIYLIGFRGGQVDPAGGTFLFTAKSGYLIKNGELKERLRDVSVGGLTLKILSDVDAVGKDMKFKGGTCGKGGQGIPNTTGSPHIRIKDAVIGGR